MKLLKVLRSTTQFEPDLLLIYFFWKGNIGQTILTFRCTLVFENRVNAEFWKTLWFNYALYGSQCSNGQYASTGQYGLAQSHQSRHRVICRGWWQRKFILHLTKVLFVETKIHEVFVIFILSLTSIRKIKQLFDLWQ